MGEVKRGTEVLSVVIFELWDAGQYTPELCLACWIGGKFSVQF